MTRDGTFLIEDGKIAYPIKNLRFNQVLPEMLRDVVGKTENVKDFRLLDWQAEKAKEILGLVLMWRFGVCLDQTPNFLANMR